MYKQEEAGERVNEESIYQPSEILIVLSSNTIVQPLAMVVEFFTAPIARATMLSSLLDIGLTDVAEKVHWLVSIFPNRAKNFTHFL